MIFEFAACGPSRQHLDSWSWVSEKCAPSINSVLCDHPPLLSATLVQCRMLHFISNQLSYP